jgi:universal stress protein A
MSEYRHILAALELEDASREVLRKAQTLARITGARLSVLHVLELIPVRPGGIGEIDPPMMASVDLSEQLTENARQRLLPWCTEFGIAEDALEIVFDSIKIGIVEHAERIAADLIVVGRHPHHGFSALFSHTEQGVLNRAKCDVLAVVLPDS